MTTGRINQVTNIATRADRVISFTQEIINGRDSRTDLVSTLAIPVQSSFSLAINSSEKQMSGENILKKFTISDA